MNFKLETPILTMKFGSHLYGTNTPSSDLDYKSVFIPNGKDILLGQVQNVRVINTKSDNDIKNSVEDIDNESFSLQKYLKLLAAGQTVALDMLFAPDEMIVEKNPETFWIWETIRKNTNKLVSRESASFIGYCRQQANKYGIKGSRVNEAEKLMKFFEERMDKYHLYKIGDFKEELAELIEGMEHTEFLDIKTPNGSDLRHISCCTRKAPFTITVKEAYSIYSKLYENYGVRAKQAKDNNNTDLKATSHAVRVGTEAIELATTGHITFPLPNAEYIRDIKMGKVPFEQVSLEIDELLIKVEEAFAASHLPEKPDFDWIDNFVAEVYRSQV